MGKFYKNSTIFIYAFSFFVIGFYGINFILNNIYSTPPQNLTASAIDASNLQEIEKNTGETTLYFVGDIMLDRGVKSSVKKNFEGDYNKLFINLEKLKKADILFGNLEGDVSNVGNNVGSKFSFRMDPNILPVLKDAGFDIVSFANNHVGDWNILAFKDTLTRLADIGILKTGAGFTKNEAETPTIIEKNGILFCFLGFSDVGPNWIKATEKAPGILLASDPQLPEIIKKAKSKCDVLITSFHWGVEYKKIHNARQETLAHTAIDNGADMVIGHHPHVIEDIEIYKEKPIVYSLGNFIFDQYFSKDTMRGMLFQATFSGSTLKNTEKKIIELNKYYQPTGIYPYTEEKVSDNSIVKNTCPKPTKEYLDVPFLNVNQDVSLLDKTYIPKDLEPLSEEMASKSGVCLSKESKVAFEKMAQDAMKEKIIIKVTSGFRSYETQKAILANSKKTNKDADKFVAKPGYSEHQLGTAMDISGKSISYGSATAKFEGTIESEWLKNNAYKYGFIMSYPKGKESVTGYGYEPWHYRYLGIDNAKYINDNNLTIIEFFQQKR